MFIKIENYIIDTDSVAAISLWHKIDEDYESFKRGDRFMVDDLDFNYFCILIDFKRRTSDEDFEEIKLFAKCSDEAWEIFDKCTKKLFNENITRIPLGFGGLETAAQFETNTQKEQSTTTNLFDNV